MFSEILKKLTEKNNLTREEAYEAMTLIMEGEVSPVLIAAFLTALKMKGETAEEIGASAEVIKEKALKVDYIHENLIDCCGMGGDGAHTFNISTTAAFVAAGAGVKVAKHGNRSITSRSGGADVLEKLGVNLEISAQKIAQCIEEANIGFMFAPAHHASFKYAMPVRRELGFRTILNILGPLSNPANVRKQVLGVFSRELVPLIGQALAEMGTKHAMVVHGEDGLDEITLTGKTYVAEVKDKKIIEWTVNPEENGFKLCKLEEIVGGEPEENARILKNILMGEQGPKTDISILNAAASIYVSGISETYEQGIILAEESLKNGNAMKMLNKLIEVSNR